MWLQLPRELHGQLMLEAAREHRTATNLVIHILELHFSTPAPAPAPSVGQGPQATAPPRNRWEEEESEDFTYPDSIRQEMVKLIEKERAITNASKAAPPRTQMTAEERAAWVRDTQGP